MKTVYRVKFMKQFTSGMLNGLAVDAALDFPSLETATCYVGFLMKHTETPVKTNFGTSDYTCHVIHIDAVQK